MFVARFTKRLGSKAAFSSKPVCIQRKKEKDKKDSETRIIKGYLWREKSMKAGKNIVYVCVFVGHGLRSTSFILGVAKKSEVPICSARTSLTYPSSFCQVKYK